MPVQKYELWEEVWNFVGDLRKFFKSLMEAGDYSTRVSALDSLSHKSKELSLAVTQLGHKELQLVCSPFSIKMDELVKKPSSLGPESLRFVAFVLDYLCEVSGKEPSPLDFGKDRQFRVLIIDDEPLSLRATGVALETHGFVISTQNDSYSSLSLFDLESWDVMLLDVEMPELNGYQLCEKIRESNFNSQTPVIFVTGNNIKEIKQKAKECGANDIVSKPFSFSELSVRCWIWAFTSIRSPQKIVA